MKLRIRALAMAMGICLGLFFFLGTLYSMWFGHGTSVFINLVWYFPGYDRTFLGAVIGLIGGFIEGFVAGAVVAWLYNVFYKVFYKAEPTK
jgi:hypothetical protein